MTNFMLGVVGPPHFVDLRKRVWKKLQGITILLDTFDLVYLFSKGQAFYECLEVQAFKNKQSVHRVHPSKPLTGHSNRKEKEKPVREKQLAEFFGLCDCIVFVFIEGCDVANLLEIRKKAKIAGIPVKTIRLETK